MSDFRSSEFLCRVHGPQGLVIGCRWCFLIEDQQRILPLASAQGSPSRVSSLGGQGSFIPAPVEFQKDLGERERDMA